MLRFLVASVLAILVAVPVAALAQSTTGTVAGTVKTAAGSPVAGAQVTITGPERHSALTDAQGSFSFTVGPGLYNIVVSKGGFVPATQSDLAVFSGETQPLNVTLTQADLSSLRTIASVSTGARGSQINTGTATISYLPAAQIQDLANPQINSVLQRLPDTVIQKMGSQPDTTIVLGGVQPYETQVLIDGHPLSLGQYGVWLSEYFNSSLLEGVETQTGPGNTTPFAATAVGGTANLVTPGFTTKPTVSFTVGSDNYDSQYSSFLATGSWHKFQYVAGLGYGSSNGPFFRGNHCVFDPADPANDNTPASAGIIQFCGDSSGSLFTKGEILKLRYNFTPQTSFEMGFIGAQGGFLPQGTQYGNYIGQTQVLPCINTGNWNGPGSATNICTNPAQWGLVGTTIPGYTWYPGSNVYSNQPIFTAQLRTSFGNTTLLDRPYMGNLDQPIIDGLGEQDYPLFWSQPGVAPTGDANFENYCNNGTGFTGAIINPTPPGPIVNGPAGPQEECNQTVFSEYEQDKLYGNTLSLLEPMGDDLFGLNWDFHGDNTFAYYNTPSQVAVPNTTERYNTISLTGDVRLSQTLLTRFGLYDSMWSLAGSQPSAPGSGTLVPLSRSLSLFDPHIGLVYQPKGNVSYRVAYGTGETFPFSGLVSGLPAVTPQSLTFPNGFVTQKNPLLNPERSSEWSLGGDMRMHNGALLSLDLQNDNINDVFETNAIPNAIAVPGQAIGYALITPFNAANLRTKTAIIKYNYAPREGFGYNASVTFESSQVTGIPDGYYVLGPSLPANGQQVCSFGEATPGTPTCIPYIKGYGQLTYTAPDNTFAEIGVDLEGKNNTYNQPPFIQVDATVKRPLTNYLEAQISVENLLNTNNFYNLPMPNAGVATVAGMAGGQLTQLPSSLIPAEPRTFRFQLRWHSGKP